MNKKYQIALAVIVAVLLIGGASVYAFIINLSKSNKTGIACTMEAKLCSDGSYVGRSGPNCEFVCPPANIASYDSGVQGTVTLGPTCPVMRVGDTTCADKPYTTDIQVMTVASSRDSLFATIGSDGVGKYKIMLPPGQYVLQPVGGAVLPRCATQNITIVPSKIITVDLSCDTGIR